MPRRKVYHLKFSKKRWELKGAAAKHFRPRTKLSNKLPRWFGTRNPAGC